MSTGPSERLDRSADAMNIASPQSGAGAPEVLRLEGITKRFGVLVANDAIDLALRRGEVLALLGKNGAGKTTLMSILFGHYVADEGNIRVERDGGRPGPESCQVRHAKDESIVLTDGHASSRLRAMITKSFGKPGDRLHQLAECNGFKPRVHPTPQRRLAVPARCGLSKKRRQTDDLAVEESRFEMTHCGNYTRRKRRT